MKCPKCGYVTSESKQNCGKCGNPLPAAAGRNPGTAVTTPDPDPSAAPVSAGPASADPQKPIPVPEWRKQVTEKVKAYGERKKYLTTPPGPLKDSSSGAYIQQPPPAPSPQYEQQQQHQQEQSLSPAPDNPVHARRPAPVVPATAPTPRPPVVLPERQERPEQVPAADDASGAPPQPYQPQPPAKEKAAAAEPKPKPAPAPTPTRIVLDVHADDLNDVAFFEDEEPAEVLSDQPAELYLARRGAALLIDSVILLALHFFLIWVCAQIIGYDYQHLLAQVWQPFLGVFLIFHCVYYFYFYRTSRQTPGQVFLGIEVRDPAAGTITASKILIRWAAMVFLNVINFLTLFESDRYLLLDRLSRTEIRKLR